EGAFDVKLYGPVLTNPLGSNIIKYRIKGFIFNGSNCNFQRKVNLDLSYFTLIYLTLKDHFIYIGKNRNGSTIVKIIALNHLVAGLYGYIQNHPVYGRAYHGICRSSQTAG